MSKTQRKRETLRQILRRLRNLPNCLLKSGSSSTFYEISASKAAITFWRHFDLTKHSVTLGLLFGLALVFSTSTRLAAQPRSGTAVQETEDEYKVNTYKRFVENREPNPAAAYQAARDYMQRYNKEDDQYTRY